MAEDDLPRQLHANKTAYEADESNSAAIHIGESETHE